MALDDAAWYPDLLSQTQNIATEILVMAVDNVIRAVFLYETFEFQGIFPGASRTGQYFGTEASHLFIQVYAFGIVNHEVQVKFLSVNAAQNMHQPHLHAANIQTWHNVQYSYAVGFF